MSAFNVYGNQLLSTMKINIMEHEHVFRYNKRLYSRYVICLGGGMMWSTNFINLKNICSKDIDQSIKIINAVLKENKNSITIF